MVRPQKWDLIIVGSGAGACSCAGAGEEGASDRNPRPAAASRLPSEGEIIQPNGLRLLDRFGLLRNFSPPIFIEMSVWTSFKKKDRFSAPSIIVSSLLLIPIL